MSARRAENLFIANDIDPVFGENLELEQTGFRRALFVDIALGVAFDRYGQRPAQTVQFPN
jgi:hypothetical protein